MCREVLERGQPRARQAGKGDAGPSRTRAGDPQRGPRGPAGSGKTTLVETLLVSAGVLSRAGSTLDGTTVTDFDEAEHRQQRSVGLALAPLVHGDVKINLLDAPGYADFVGELRAGLRAADCAMFVVAANEGIDEPTRTLWRECAEVGMPRAVVITKLDHARADYDGVVAQAQGGLRRQGRPGRTCARAAGSSGLLSDDHAHDEQRGALIEAVIEESEDETLMDRYLGGRGDRPRPAGRRPRARGRPRLVPPGDPGRLDAPASAPRSCSTSSSPGFPSPLEHPLPEVFTPAGAPGPAISCDPDGPLVAEIVKTTTDPYVGRVSLVRVFSGTAPARRDRARLRATSRRSSARHRGHEDHDEDERIGALSVPLGATLSARPARASPATSARSPSSPAPRPATPSPTRRPRWCSGRGTMPEPLLPLAIQARAKADEDKLSQGLQRLAAEDPTLRIEHNAETHQIVLWCMGEAHADVVIDRLATRHGAAVDQVELKVPLRETFAGRRRRATAGTSSSRAGTGSTPSATSTWSRCPEGGGLRVRRQGGRRRRAPAVHPVGGEGGPRPDGEGRRRRLPRRRHQGHAHRRQGAQRRLLRHGLPDRRRPGAARGRRRRRGSSCSSRSTRWR